MNVAEAKSRYLEGGDSEVLALFHKANPTLSDEHTCDLIEILSNPSNDDWGPKYFAAELLGYYESAAETLLAPMLRAAVEVGNPSFNRCFLRPALTIYGRKAVVKWLTETFITGSIVDRLRVSLLTYLE